MLLGFLLTLAATGMRLYRAHAYLCAIMYVGFLVWVVAFKGVAPSMFS